MLKKVKKKLLIQIIAEFKKEYEPEFFDFLELNFIGKNTSIIAISSQIHQSVFPFLESIAPRPLKRRIFI